MKYYKILFALLLFSCQGKINVDLPEERSIYLDVVQDVIDSSDKYGRVSICEDCSIKDPEVAFDFFRNGERMEHIYEVDTIGDFIFERSGFGYMYMTSDFIPGIDAWVIKSVSSHKESCFLNLIHPYVRHHLLYGEEAQVKKEIMDTILEPDFENRLNRVLKDLDITSIEDVQLILSKLLGYRIRHKEELRIESFLYEMEHKFRIDQSEAETCKRVLQGEPLFSCIYTDGYCDLYESPYRGIYQVVYFSDGLLPYKLKLDLLLFECNFPTYYGYRPYSVKIKEDKEMYSDTMRLLKLVK